MTFIEQFMCQYLLIRFVLFQHYQLVRQQKTIALVIMSNRLLPYFFQKSVICSLIYFFKYVSIGSIL